jgi:hypothetical protein
MIQLRAVPGTFLSQVREQRQTDVGGEHEFAERLWR